MNIQRRVSIHRYVRVCVCVYVHKVSRSYNTAVTEDDSAKPRLRFPVRERFRLYVYRYVAGLVHSTLDTYTVIFSPLEEREYQKLEEKAGTHCTQKKNWGNNRRRSKSVPRRGKKKTIFSFEIHLRIRYKLEKHVYHFSYVSWINTR